MRGKNKTIFYAAIILLCIIAAPAAALTQITPAELASGTYQCNIAGETYEITGDVIGATGNPVIQINAANVIVTSQTGIVTITANAGSETFADATSASTPTFSNLAVSGFDVGFHMLSAADASMVNCEISDCREGFQIYSCNDFTATDVVISGSSEYAVNTSYLDWGASLTNVTVADPATPVSYTSADGILIRDLGTTILPDPIGREWIGPDPDSGDKYVIGIDYNGNSFPASGTLSFQYTDADIAGIEENTLAVYRYRPDTGWQEVAGSVVDPDANTVSATISMTSSSDDGFWYAPTGGGRVVIDTFPYTITVPGNYYIGTNYTTTGSVVLVTIEASNVTLDGMEHVLRGTSQQGYGVRIHGTDATSHRLNNVIVKNFTLSDFYYNIWSEYTDNAQITDMTLSGASSAAYLSNFDHSSIDNVTISGGNSGIEITGVFGTTPTGATVADSTITGCLYNGISEQTGYNSYILVQNTTVSAAGRTGIYLNGYRHTVDTCTITGPGEVGVRFDQPSGADYYGHIMDNTTITGYNAPASSTQYPLYIGADDVTIRNSRIADSQWGILIGAATAKPDGTTLDSVTIENMTAPNLGSGVISAVKISQETDNTQITGCTIGDISPVSSVVNAYGIHLYAQNAAYPVENVTITDTTITNVEDGGIRAEYATDLTITGTTITDLPGEQSYGVYALDADSLTADGLTIINAGYGGFSGQGCDGISLTDTAVSGITTGMGINLQDFGSVTVAGADLTNVSVTNVSSYGIRLYNHDTVTIGGATITDIGGQYGIRFDDTTGITATDVRFRSLPTDISFTGGGAGFFGMAGTDALPATALPDGKVGIGEGVMVQRSVPGIALDLSMAYNASALPVLTDENSLRLNHHLSSTGWVECGVDSYVNTTAEEVHADLSDTPTGTATWFFLGPLINETGLTLPYTITEPGTYYLDQDFTGIYPSAITILSDDVVLEGNAHAITTTSGGDTTGIIIGDAGGTRYTNIAVKNFTLSGFTTGIDAVNVDELSVSSIGVADSGDGFVFADIADSSFTTCIADAPANTGFTLGGNTNTVAITDCQVINAAGSGIFSSLTTDTNITITNATVTGSGSTGIALAGTNMTLDASRVEDAAFSGISTRAGASGIVIRDTVVEQPGINGVSLASATVTLTGVTINGTGENGIYVNPNDGTITNMPISGVTITNSTLNGIWVSSGSGDLISGVSITDSTIQNSGWRGLDVTSGGGTITGLTVTNITITNTSLHGIRIDGGYEAPTITGPVITDVTVTNAGQHALYLTGCSGPEIYRPVITTTLDGAGIEVQPSSDILISAPVITNTSGWACAIRGSERTDIINPTVSETGGAFLLWNGNRTVLSGGTVAGNDTAYGVWSTDSSDVVITGVNFTGNEMGINMMGGDNVTLADIRMEGTVRVISANSDTTNITVNQFSIGSLNTTIDTAFSHGLVIDQKDSFPPAPVGHALINHGVTITRSSGYETEPVNLSIYYTAEDVAGLDAETLRLYSTDGTDWAALPDMGGVDTTARYVWADFNVSTSGMWIAPLATTTVTVTIPVDLSAGWNMISVPVANATFEVPAETGSIYRYSNSMYESVSGMGFIHPGEGVWISAIAPCTLNMTGEPMAGYTYSSASGWNMIGSAGESMPFTGHLTTDPAGLLGPSIYTYNPAAGSYGVSTSCVPGTGYWAETSTSCMIILN